MFDTNKNMRELERLLIEWSLINTHSENLIGLDRFCRVLERSFSVLGGKVERILLPQRTTINHLGKEIHKSHGEALRIRKHLNAKTQVFLGGHMDTVYPLTSPFQKTRPLDSNTLIGPGVADMKGGLLIILKSLEILENSEHAGKIGWEVLINPDEEIGSIGSHHLFIEAAKRNHFALLFEPSFPDGSLVSSRKGSANYTIVVNGRAAHSGRDFYEGRNAILKCAQGLLLANEMNQNNKGLTLNVGCFEGGNAINIVPELAIGKINIRMNEDEDLEIAHDKLEKIVNAISKEEGFKAKLHQESLRRPKLFDEKNQKLFSLLQKCAEELGFNLHAKPSGGACDGNIMSAESLPTIDSLGVIGGNIHTENEYILLDSLPNRISLVSHFLLKLAVKE